MSYEPKEIIEDLSPIIKGIFSIMFIRLVIALLGLIRRHGDLLDGIFSFICIALLCWYAVFSYIDASSEKPPFGPIYFYIDILTSVCLARLLYKSVKAYIAQWKSGVFKNK